MSEPTIPIDVNTATADELDAVPGLRGHGYEIVRYRGERGGFTDLRSWTRSLGCQGTLMAAVQR